MGHPMRLELTQSNLLTITQQLKEMSKLGWTRRRLGKKKKKQKKNKNENQNKKQNKKKHIWQSNSSLYPKC